LHAFMLIHASCECSAEEDLLWSLINTQYRCIR
jgi:hypothetical protein